MRLTKNNKMVILKNREEIELMRESALSVSRTLGIIAKEIKPGVTSLHLDKIAEEFQEIVQRYIESHYAADKS